MEEQTSRLSIVIDSRNAERDIARLRAALGGLGGAAGGAGRGADDLTRSNNRLSRSASESTTVVQRLRTSLQNLSSSIGGLQSLFGGFIATMGIASMLKTADAMQSLNSRIKLATDSTEEYLAVQSRLRGIAQSNATEYDSLVTVYADSSRALKQLGKTQNETLAFTDNLTKAMFVGGAGAAAQAGALRQLGQALNANRLSGDEYVSIAEQAPILLQLIAKEMGVTQGALKKLGSEGKIAANVIYNAVSKATVKLDEMVAKMPLTMAQGLETVKNSYKFFIDDMLNTTGGFSSIVSGALVSLGKNLDSLIPILVAGGLAWGTYALATSTAATTGMAAAITSMTSMGYWFASNTLLINAQITSYLSLTAVIDRYNLNMMLARLTLASYVDLAKTTAATVQAKAVAMTNAVKATLANIGADIRHGQVLASLAGATRAAAAAIVQKVAAMRSGITAAGVYAASLRVVAGAAAVTATAIKGLGAAFASLGAIIKAHPIMVIGSVLLAFVAASKNAEGKILGLSGAMSSLGDAVKVLGYVLVDIIGGIKDVASTFGKFIVSMISNSEKGANESSNMFEIFFGNTESGFVGMLQVIARFADLAGATMKTLVEAIARGFSNMLTDVSNKFASLGNSIFDIMNKVTKAITGVVNGGLDLISGMVSIANKIPFVNIADDKRRSVAKTIDTRFNDNKKLDTRGFSYELGKNYGSFSNDGMANRLQGHIDSMKGAKLEANANLDLAGAITATGDESDKAKKKKVKNAKKVKEAVDKEREAFERMMETYQQQMGALAREAYDLKFPFVTEVNKMGFELSTEFGKFKDFPAELKQNLADAAKELDLFKSQRLGSDMLNELQDELELLGNGNTNPLRELLYSLNNARDIVSTISGEMKTLIVNAAIDVDVKKHKLAMTDMLKDTQKQLNLLNAIDDLDRQKMEIEYESLDILEQFNYLTKIGQQAKYDELKASLDVLTAAKLRLAVETKQVEATKAVQDTVKDLNKEIALFDSTDAMAEFYYDLEKTDKYLHASVKSVQNLEQALLSLKMLNANKAFDDLRSDQEGLDSSPVGQIMQAYEDKLATIREYEATHVEILENSSAARLEVERAYNQARAAMMVDSGEVIFGSMSSMAKDALGEQSGVYRAMFAIEKGFAIARSIMAIQTAMASATASLPFPANLPVIAQVAAQGAQIISNIKAVAGAGFKQGGYTGNMGASQVAGVVHGQEYVFDAQSTKRIGVDNLNAMRSGKSVGETKVIVNNYSNEKANVQTTPNGDTIVTIGKIAQGVAQSEIHKFEKRLTRQGGPLHGMR